MPALPSRSPGVLISGLQGEFVVYDLVTETVHDLNGTAGELLTRCDGATPTDDLVDEWATRTGTDRPEIARGVDAALAEFTRLGLVDRRGGWTPPPRLAGSTATPPDDAVTGAAHPALDRRVVFRSTDPALLDAIDGVPGCGNPGGSRAARRDAPHRRRTPRRRLDPGRRR